MCYCFQTLKVIHRAEFSIVYCCRLRRARHVERMEAFQCLLNTQTIVNEILVQKKQSIVGCCQAKKACLTALQHRVGDIRDCMAKCCTTSIGMGIAL
jgi:hypothetical protein